VYLGEPIILWYSELGSAYILGTIPKLPRALGVELRARHFYSATEGDSSVNRILRSITAAILLLLLVTPALAQSGRLVYHDDAGMLDRSRMQSAAQPLINRGATVAVYAEDSGGDAAFQQRLEQDGLAKGTSISNSVIAIFVSLQDRYSAIRFGD